MCLRKSKQLRTQRFMFSGASTVGNKRYGGDENDRSNQLFMELIQTVRFDIRELGISGGHSADPIADSEECVRGWRRMRLIDADALKEYMKPTPRAMLLYCDTNNQRIWEAECKEIDAQPTVDPIKHGHWIRSSDGYWDECSKCHASIDISMGSDLYDADGNEVENDWCPHCGAKMDEVEK